LIKLDKIKVDGKRIDKKVFLYTLSTCGWCKKAKEYLKNHSIQYEYVDVDKCTREEQKEIIQELKEKNTPTAFPVIMIDEKIISGYKEKEIGEALDLN
jgi:glutaredoxin